MKSKDNNELLNNENSPNELENDKNVEIKVEKSTKETKAKDKLLKEQAKQAKKDSKRAMKIERKKEFKQLFNEFEGHDGTQEGKIKAAKNKKIKKHKDKIDYKLAFKEAPIKFLKEINKIKWSSRQNLGTKFLWVIIFIFIFGLFFFLVDWGLQSLFVVIKII